MVVACLLIAAAFVVAGFVFLLTRTVSHGMRRPLFLACLVAADFVLVLPLALQEAGGALLGITLAPYDVASMVVMEGRMDDFRQIMQGMGSPSAAMTTMYLVLLQLLYVATPVAAALAAYAVITKKMQNLRVCMRMLRAQSRPDARVFVLAGASDRAFTFAENLFTGQDAQAAQDAVCVFCGISRDDEERWTVRVEKLKTQGVLLCELSATELADMLERRRFTRLARFEDLNVMFLGDSSGDNLSDAIPFIERVVQAVPLGAGDTPAERTAERFYQGRPRFHVFCRCDGISDELVLDSIADAQGIDVRVIDECREVAYDLVFQYPVYNQAILSESRRPQSRGHMPCSNSPALANHPLDDSRRAELRVARISATEADDVAVSAALNDDHQPSDLVVIVVGCGGHGFEIARACLWSGQLPGMRLAVHVVDQKPVEEMRGLFASFCPDVNRQGLAQLEFHCARADRSELFEVLDAIDLGTCKHPYVAVTLGNDDLSTDVGLAVRRRFLANEPMSGVRPRVFIHIQDDRRYKAVNNLRAGDGRGGLPLDVVPFGGLRRLYSLSGVVDVPLQALGYNVNACYSGALDDQVLNGLDETERIKRRQDLFLGYSAWQMNRLSSIACALGLRVKLWWLGFDLDFEKGANGSGSDDAKRLQTLLEQAAELPSRAGGASLLDDLARSEHDRWVMFYCTEGWRNMSPSESNLYKEAGLSNGRHDSHLLMLHPYICPFDSLPSVAAAMGKEDPTKYDVAMIQRAVRIATDAGGYVGMPCQVRALARATNDGADDEVGDAR